MTKESNLKSNIIIVLVVAALLVLGIMSVNIGKARYSPSIRSVVLIDVGSNMTSLTKEQYSYIFGVFVDKFTGDHFKKPIDLTTYDQFKAGNQKPINMVRNLSIDDIENSSFGELFRFLGMACTALGFLGILLTYSKLKADFMVWMKDRKKLKHA